jgi:glucokinase
MELTALEIAKAASEYDDLAQQLVWETAEYLARGIVIVAHLIDPHAIMLGGAMNFGGPQSDLGKKFLSQIRERVYRNTFPEIAANLAIDFASLGSDAGFIGAAGLARVKYWQTQNPSIPAAATHG